jgi:hypothetical protein
MKIIHKDTTLLPGLELESREDGVWLHFSIADRKHAHINLSNIAKESSPIVKDAMYEWLKDYATHEDAP